MLSLLAHLNARRIWQVPVRLSGNQFRAPTLDRLLALLLFRFGLAGRSEFHLIRSLLRPGMTVVDIGANQGVFTLFFADLVGPTGRVYAFEPEPVMFAALEGNVKANEKGWVMVHNQALGAAQGDFALKVSGLNRGHNRLVADPLVRSGAVTTVRVAALDGLLEGVKPDFVKMDVQGWECAVLRGMAGLLSSPQAPWILFEIYPDGLHEAGDSVAILTETLRRNGYSLCEADLRRTPLDIRKAVRLRGGLGYMNALAVPPQQAVPRASS